MRPDALEAVEVGAGHVAGAGFAEVEDRCVCCGDAIGLGVDEKVVVASVDRVVEHGVVEPDRDVFEVVEWLVEDEAVADLCGHGFADAFVRASFGDFRAVGIAEEDADVHAAAGFVGDELDDAAVFGEEEASVGEDADLVLGAAEELEPGCAGNSPSMGIGRDDLG